MKRGKMGVICIGLIMLAACLVGCSKAEKDTKKNEVKAAEISYERKKAKVKLKEDIVVVSDNCEPVISNNAGSNAFQFFIITKNKVKKNDIKITFDKEKEYTVSVLQYGELGHVQDGDNGDVNIKKRTTMSYNGVDWKEYLKVYENSDEEELEHFENKYLSDYTGVIDCYFYEVSVSFNTDTIKEDDTLKKMYIEYKGNKIEKDIDVKFLHNVRNEEDELPDVFYSVSSSTVMEWRTPNNTGELGTYTIQYKADKKFVIKGVNVVGDNGIVVDSVDVAGSAVNGIQQKMQGDISVNKGDTVTLYVRLRDDDFKNQLSYNKNVIITMDYEVEGELHQEVYGIRYLSAAPMDELYAKYVDGVDMMQYYNEFHSVVH
ncbi:MAG: hypothetical protein E7262_03610 [Lachnospiraceae bacterium]|nr:hypothetical protein [Lachnospiraceae bacterium]